MKTNDVVDRVTARPKQAMSWLVDTAKSTTGKVVTAGALTAGTLFSPVTVDHSELHAADKPGVSQTEQVPLNAEVRTKLASLFKAKELDETKINRAFNDPAYSKNLDYILEKLPKAKARGLEGIGLNEVFSLHPVVAHSIVRASYITYYASHVLSAEDTKDVLDRKSITSFGLSSKPTREEVKDFVENFVEDFVIPGMEENLRQEYQTVRATYSSDNEIKQKTMYGYNARYKPGFDDVTLFIAGKDPSRSDTREGEVAISRVSRD